MTPTKSEIERAFHRLIENGDLTAIANDMGHSVEYASQLYSPDCERKSNLYRAIRELRAWRAENMERGVKALAVFNELVERDLMPEPLCEKTESLKLKTEVDEWETKSMSDVPTEQIIQEVRDIKMQAERTLEAHQQKLRAIAAKAISDKRSRDSQ